MASQSLLDAKPRLQACKPVRPDPAKPFVILGITTDGNTFRPSDWAQRLAAAATIDCEYCGPSKQLPCNPLVKVVTYEGVTGVWVSPALSARDTRLYEFVLRFAESNRLVVREAD